MKPKGLVRCTIAMSLLEAKKLSVSAQRGNDTDEAQIVRHMPWSCSAVLHHELHIACAWKALSDQVCWGASTEALHIQDQSWHDQ